MGSAFRWVSSALLGDGEGLGAYSSAGSWASLLFSRSPPLFSSTSPSLTCLLASLPFLYPGTRKHEMEKGTALEEGKKERVKPCRDGRGQNWMVTREKVKQWYIVKDVSTHKSRGLTSMM